MGNIRRTDDNQEQIVNTLRALGVHVRSLSRLGGGIPDLLCSFRGVWYLVEVKNSLLGWKYTPVQKKFFHEANAKVVTLTCDKDAIAWVGKIAKESKAA